MMTETELTTCSRNKTAPVNVLFVGNRPVSENLTDCLNKNAFLWDCVSVDDFRPCVQSRSIHGTVIIDGTQITPDKAAVFQELFEQLDRQDVSIIFYNTPEFVNTETLQLATEINSIVYEELWARIECNVRYYRRLQKDLAAKDAHQCQLYVNKDTARQLEMAGHVQRNFLPSRLPHTDNIRFATLFRPAEWVSGDLYDIARLDEEYIGFYLADAVGHSMPAALLTMFLKQATVMRQTIDNNYYIFKPWEVMSTLNLRMAEQELAGCLFATSFYGLLNIKTLRLDYARAGHPYPLLIRDNQLIQLECCGGLLGIFPEADFEQKSVQLKSGDKVFVFSDGLEPVIGDNDEKGRFRPNEAFSEICRLPAEQMIQALDVLAQNHHSKPGEIDDVTGIAMEIS